jgi:hypothetical protein
VSKRAEVEEIETALLKLYSEVSWFVNGGDDPDDRCSGCGNPGYGMMVDAMCDAGDLLRKLGRLPTAAPTAPAGGRR